MRLNRRFALGCILIATGLFAVAGGCGRLSTRVYPLRYERTIVAVAARHDLDPYLLAAVIYEESKFNANARSPAGARGLMQIMPETGRWIAGKMRIRDFQPSDLDDPGLSIRMGGWYLAYLVKKYGSLSLALAAYNAGDRKVDRWLAKQPGAQVEDVVDSIPYPETRDFVRDVKSTAARYRSLYAGRLALPRRETVP